MFIKESKDKFRYIDTDSDVVLKQLNNMLYEVIVEQSFFGTNYYFKENTAYNKGIVAEEGVFKEIKEYVFDFFSAEGKEVREDMALSNRVNLLFTGEPGTGKTFLAGQLARQLCEREQAIALTFNNVGEIEDLGAIVDMARRGDPTRLVVLIWDEFEKSYKNAPQKRKDKLLTFLDGVDSRDNVVVIATCNDLSVFPDTILNRPGRFERVAEFKITDGPVLENIVKAMIPEKYKTRFDQQIIVDAAKKIENPSADKIKSLVRDSLVNLLKGKEDIIPKDENRAKMPEKKSKEQKNNPLLKKVDPNHIYLASTQFSFGDEITILDLLNKADEIKKENEDYDDVLIN